jgi:hypothetical protein
MPKMYRHVFLLVTSLCFICSCSKEDGADRKGTFPVTGQVLVDGSPAEGVAVTCQDVNGVDKANPTVSGAVTDKEGNFAISTYKAGDGVPNGDYVLTFFLAEMNMLTKEYGPDKLSDRYKDPKTSTFKFSVKGAPVKVDKIDLSTK